MQAYLQQIISQENIKLSNFNDEELAQFSEHCFNIINQFYTINIHDFTLLFHEYAIQKIKEEEDEEEERQLEIEIKEAMKQDFEYYSYLERMEQFYQNCINDIRKEKQTLPHVRVELLKQKIQPEQRSQEWYDMRYNMLTASDIGTIIGVNCYQKPKDVLLKKCGHKSFRGNKYTWHGQMYEPIATSIYESRYFCEVIEFGLLQHDTIPYLGASPDGITPEGIMIEIKCPYTRTINGNIKDKKTMSYYAQIQAQLEVCDLEICHFWECRFEIAGYDSLDSYNQDLYIPTNITSLNIIPTQQTLDLNVITLPNDRRSSNGLEKGILLRYKHKYTDDDYKYLYPPFMVSTQEQLDWINKQLERNLFEFHEFVYWKLLQTSNCVVNRDRVWWNQQVIPKLKPFWDEVLYRRQNGCEDIMPKKRKFITKTNKSISNILDLSDMNLKKPEFMFDDSIFNDDDKPQFKYKSKSKSKSKSNSQLQPECMFDDSMFT